MWQTKEIVDHFGLLDLKKILELSSSSEKIPTERLKEYVILSFNVKSFQLRFLEL